MKLVVIADLHLAKVWDKIDKIIPKKLNILNPNRYFRKVISKINPKDFLIFNGDLVDYYYSSYTETQDTNWKIFFDILGEHKSHSLFNFGNHDYRKIPYNFKLYGLRHINISPTIQKKYSKAIGYNHFRYFKEFDSINVNLEKFNPIPSELENYPKKKKWHNSKVILLNTGADAATKFKDAINPLNWSSVWSTNPSSIGLSENNIKMVKKELSSKGNNELLLFLHCPPFLSKEKIPKIHLAEETYSHNLKKYNLDYWTFLENNWAFIESLMDSTKNIIVITSHAHMAKQYLIDKSTKTLQESSMREINKLRKHSRYIKFISTLPFGALIPSREIGYLTITEKKIKYVVIKKF